jgi:oligopeptide transport system permease protein
MTRYIIRRILGFIPVLLAITLFTFVLMRAIPGGPFDFAGERALPPQIVANIEAKYHLDWPLWKQFLSYLVGDDVLGEEGTSRGVIRGDLGPSLRYRNQSVNDIIATTFPISAQLGVLSIILALMIGVPAGIVAALNQNTWLDYTSTFAAVIFLSVPNLVLAPILIWIFAVSLGWLPVSGWGSKPPYMLFFFPNPQEFFSWNYWSHAILPVFALGTAFSASMARLTRGSLLQVIREDYIRTARAKGLRERAVIVVHALKNSLIPVVTVLGPLFAGVVTGTFVVEQIFGINGMGKHFILSVGNRDYQVITGLTLLFGLLLVIANLLVDITYAWLDPRIRFE